MRRSVQTSHGEVVLAPHVPAYPPYLQADWVYASCQPRLRLVISLATSSLSISIRWSWSTPQPGCLAYKNLLDDRQCEWKSPLIAECFVTTTGRSEFGVILWPDLNHMEDDVDMFDLAMSAKLDIYGR